MFRQKICFTVFTVSRVLEPTRICSSQALRMVAKLHLFGIFISLSMDALICSQSMYLKG